MTDKPKLVSDDPWLEPHSEVIVRRMSQFHDTLQSLTEQAGSLRASANTHEFLGVHYHPNEKRWTVREWAPAAQAIHLIGDFNGWDRESHPLRQTENGVWELELAANTLAHRQQLKLQVRGADGRVRDRIPACIRRAVQDPTTHDYAGQIWHPESAYIWQHPQQFNRSGAPRIYEAHVGMAGEEPRLHTYREFADHVLPRIHQGGYNCVQLMAIQEHPYYGSFGYHVSSFFAPCSRFGPPEDLKYLIDTAHGLGIAVLLDLVHSHAVKNIAEGLNDFDGSGHQYFHEGPLGDHSGWDSKCFNYSNPAVRQFLLSNVRYWLEEFRFDGFRFDGITSMLYRSRGMKSFGHYGDYFGDDADEDAILYLKLANQLIEDIDPDALSIAEDMSGMPGLCRPISEGGVGFDYRLGMGIPDHWIKLLKHVPDEDWDLSEIWGVLSNRRHGEATIAYAESHDQALVGDKTLAFRLMDQDMYWHMDESDPHPVIERGIALHKMIRLITLVGGGEGWLNFMGNEFGHPEWIDFPREGNEWSYHYCRRQWSLADSAKLKYKWLLAFDHEMIALARDSSLLTAPPAQVFHHDPENKILVVERANLILVFNFSVASSRFDYPVHVPSQATRRLILDSDAKRFGGHARIDSEVSYPVTSDGLMKIYSPSRSAQVFQIWQD